MLDVKSILIDDGNCEVQIHSSVKDKVMITGRVVKMDFGTVGNVERKNISLTEGLNNISLTLLIPNEQPPGQYAIYFDTINSTEDSFLNDDGPYEFTKENDATT